MAEKQDLFFFQFFFYFFHVILVLGDMYSTSKACVKFDSSKCTKTADCQAVNTHTNAPGLHISCENSIVCDCL